MAKNQSSHEADQLQVVSVRLVKDAPIMSSKEITQPIDAVELIGKELAQFDRECIVVLCMKTNGIPICCSFCSVGSLNSSIAHPRELFKTAILANAASMILIHNHPSSRLTPSEEDTALTERMIELCKMIDIPLLDHIIVGENTDEYFSFREKEVLPYGKSRKVCKDYHELQFEDNLKVAEEPATQRPARRHR